MTRLRKLMIDELERRNYAKSTADAYIHALKEFSTHYHRPPDQLGTNQISQFQLHLLRDLKLSPQTVKQHMAALRFFFIHTLKRHYPPGEFRYPKTPKRLPVILSQDEVRRMIDAATTLLHRTLLMTLYSTGMRRAELVSLTVSDIDSDRMVVHIRQGKGGKDRDVPLSPKLLETLREYWRWKKPREYLFPGEAKQGSNGEHLTSKAVCHACKGAARRAGIQKNVGPHTHGIPLRLIFWNPGPTCAPSGYCSGTPASITRRCICICPSGIFALVRTRWMNCLYPTCPTHVAHGRTGRNDQAASRGG